MFNELLKLLDNAHAKYSNYKVAAICSSENKEYRGVNIENAAYPFTICAERVAIFSAITDGRKKIDSVSLITPTETFTSPCGGCRQVMAEFMNEDGEITIYNSKGEFKKYTLKDLLPYSFVSEILESK